MLEALGAFARLRRVSLVHDNGEAISGKGADLLRDHREFLKRRDDDRLAGLQGFLELPAGRVDVLHDARRLLELEDGALELAVKDATVGDDDDRVEDSPVLDIVQD